MLANTKTKVALKDIRLDGTQARAALNSNWANTLMEVPADQLPPVDLFFDNKYYWIGDGYHRATAAIRRGDRHIFAKVKLGNKRQAMLHNIAANKAARALPMTQGDKLHACKLLLKDKNFEFWTDARIAETVGCSSKTAYDARKDLEALGKVFPKNRISGDGKVVKSVPKKKSSNGKSAHDYKVPCPHCRGTGYISG